MQETPVWFLGWEGPLEKEWNRLHTPIFLGFPGGSGSKEFINNSGDLASIPRFRRSPGEGHGNPLQYSCMGNTNGQRRLAGYCPWGREGSNTTEWQHTHTRAHAHTVSRSGMETSSDRDVPGGWFLSPWPLYFHSSDLSMIQSLVGSLAHFWQIPCLTFSQFLLLCPFCIGRLDGKTGGGISPSERALVGDEWDDSVPFHFHLKFCFIFWGVAEGGLQCLSFAMKTLSPYFLRYCARPDEVVNLPISTTKIIKITVCIWYLKTKFGESFHVFDSWFSTCSLNVFSDEALRGGTEKFTI